jgi:thiol:disulfide interchange protein DsbD
MKMEMKKQLNHLLLTLLVLVSATIIVRAQDQNQNPVQWTASAAKATDGNYTITLTAVLPAPWHIYSQNTPDGGPVPTSISFSKNPLVTLIGKPKEKGDLKTTHDKNFGVDVKYYGDKVQFIQTVKVKGGLKTNVSGSVNFMVCNDHECLPPSSWKFSVKLN